MTISEMKQHFVPLLVMIVWLIIASKFTTIHSELIEIPDINRANWNYDNWKAQPPVIVTLTCNSNATTSSSFSTTYWPIKDAKRVIMTITVKPRSYCETNKTNNTDCQIEFSYQTALSETQKKSFFGGAASFPSDTFFNATKGTHTDIFAIDNITEYNGLFLTFSTYKFCGFITELKLQYYECPQVSKSLVDFNKTAAPDIYQDVTSVLGKCAVNAALESDSFPPRMECKYDGTFQIKGKCVCDAGYTKSNEETSCSACGAGFYKPSRGNIACSKCGSNSKDGEPPRKTCLCKDGFYKALSNRNDPQADCYAPPGEPKNITVLDIKSHQVTVKWDAADPGTIDNGTYIIKCLNCPSDHPVNVNTTGTSTNMDNLFALANYTFEITKENDVTKMTGQRNPKTFEFQTAEGAPSQIQNPIHETLSDGSVRFTWAAPFGQGGKSFVYVVKYGDKNLRTKSTTFTIETGTQNREYTVQIYVEASVNGQATSGPLYSAVVKVKGGISLAIALAIVFGVMIFVVVALVAAFCFWKRRNPAYLQVVRMADGTVKLPSRFYSSGQVYVDPKTFPHVDDAVDEFTFEIMEDELKLGEKIGDGEFAEVYKGALFRDGKNYQVAVKMLKVNTTNQDREDFLSEAAILGQFSDPNVVLLRGVIRNEQANPMIVLEYISHGSLDKYLQNHDMQFTTVELLQMGRGISSGMKYLSELGFIHRDLAARNILVDENRVCKIADFGMSMEIKMDDTVESLSGKIPVRWTAPEAIQFKKFTTASDVWSYGIVLWEIISYGERPYWDWTNYEVLEKVSSGYRLPPPMSCPGVVHDLMLQCWTKDRTRRPLFGIIRSRLDSWIRHPDLLEGNTIIELDDNLDYTIMQTINKWLEAISMGRYAKNFIEQGFATPRQILLLTNEDLERLGIGALEHRKRILKAIQNTREQVEGSMVRTSSVLGNPNAA